MDYMLFPVHYTLVNLSANVSGLSDFVLVGFELWVLCSNLENLGS